jgi:hypothetical protein
LDTQYKEGTVKSCSEKRKIEKKEKKRGLNIVNESLVTLGLIVFETTYVFNAFTFILFHVSVTKRIKEKEN